MLFHALLLALGWSLASSALLVTIGRHLRGLSPFASLMLILVIEACGGVAALALQMPHSEVIGCLAVSSLLGLVVIRRFPNWNAAGHAAWLFLVEVLILYLCVAALITFLVPVHLVGRVLGVLLLAMQCVAALFTLSYTHELIDVVCRRRWRRPEACPPRLAAVTSRRGRSTRRSPSGEAADALLGDPLGDWTPLVALHVPCHEEPPEVVAKTLRALRQLDYPSDAYQVYVVDNNTRDPALWRPVAALCDELGFTFLHLEGWPGYKSGALNYALAMTPPEVELIGVVDADYLVRPEYLRDLIPIFAEEAVAFVQTPQDYRDYNAESTFYQRACYHAYRYFFDLSMPSRNERNAIIFGGTMGLIRAEALRAVGGWDEWCITEDAEASLRLLMRGYEGRFVNRSYGRGLMPLEFDALKRQRFRWCFGGIQILRKHWAAMLPWAGRARPADEWEAPGLTTAQRYHYLLGGLQWYGDALTFAFTMILLGTGWLHILGRPLRLPVLGGPLLSIPLAFWLTSLLRTLWGLRATRRCTWAEALGAVGIMWSLGWVVTLASLQGLVRRRGTFLRTPKGRRAPLLRALRSTTIESLLAAACWALGLSLLAGSVPHVLARISAGGGPAALLLDLRTTPWWLLGTSTFGLAVLALLQGATYLAAPGLCLLSVRGESKAREVRRRALAGDDGEGVAERRLVTGAVVAAAAVMLLLLGTSLLPQVGTPASPPHGNALNSLLGGANPAASATPKHGGGTPSPTSQPGATPTQSATAIPTATATSRPGATPTPNKGPGGTPTPRPSPSPHGTPPPHP